MNTLPNPRSAFTLIEVLVSLGIILVLAVMIVPMGGKAIDAANRTASLSNMKQLGTLLVNYMADNDGTLPLDKGPSNDQWTTATAAANQSVWYNALPRLAGGRGVGDFATSAAGKKDFYSKRNLLFCPAAKYPADKFTATSPYFAIAMNSKLIQSFGATRVSMLAQPSKTVAFLENGLPPEPRFRSGQSGYNGQATAFASRFVARYANRTKGLLVFFDGHAELADGDNIVAPAGKAYYPQLSGNGTVLWTPDPAMNAND